MGKRQEEVDGAAPRALQLPPITNYYSAPCCASNTVLPEEFARVIVRIAEKDPIYDTRQAVDEVIYLLAWHIWDLADAEVPQWTEGLGRALDRLRPGITSKGSYVRFMTYNEAQSNSSGGGPMWHITRVFQSYASGASPVDVSQTIQVAERIAAMMKAAQAAFVGEE